MIEESGPGAGFAPRGLPTTEFVAGDPVLARSVGVRGVRRRESDGLLAVSFDLQNLTAEDLRFDYRLEWTDSEGLRIETAGRAWTPVAIRVGAKVPVRAVAPAGAARWTLLVRPSSGASGRDQGRGRARRVLATVR